MSRRDFERNEQDYWKKRREAERDREHWERWMDTVRENQRDQRRDYAAVGGNSYQGGVFGPGVYGSGAEFYSVTGMYENPLLDKNKDSHRGKGPRGYVRTDDRILDEVCERLTHHHSIDASNIDVTVQKGEVTLAGDVPDRYTKYLTEEVVEQVSGVKDIHNMLRVVSSRPAV